MSQRLIFFSNQWLGHYPESIKNWKRALDALPKSNLNPVEQIQKIQYETSLKATTATMVKQQNTVIDNINSANGRRGIKGRMPWDLAAKIIPQLSVQRPVTVANLSSFSSVCRS
jgi:stress-induced-phosphoprotein 1